MRRLYLQIYVGFLALLLLSALAAGIAWFGLREAPEEPSLWDGVAGLAAQLLPAAARPREEQQAALERLAQPFPAQVTLLAPDGARLAAVGDPLPAPLPPPRHSGFLHAHRYGPMVALRLPDGRLLLARRAHGPPSASALAVLAIVASALALGAYPLARRITRRLERLQARVDALGRGDLSARVEVEGRDEVAKLALSFNQAAQRIEQLVKSQREMLAGASHELRSPLARLRMAVELLAREEHPDLHARALHDIAELDDLIDELLLASRLDANAMPEADAEVDLLALAAEEAARVGAEVEGDPVTLRGSARLLRRLLRNLIENAQRHAAGSPIKVNVRRSADRAKVSVEDRGPGVAAEAVPHLFEPFYRPPGSRESGQGAGLGLSLVRRIARRHGGDASYRAREGGGACFEVGLALAPTQAASSPLR